MKTTVGQLREALEEYGEDVEVMIVHQQSWPLREVVGGIYDPSENGQGCQFDENGCGYDEVAELHNPKSPDFDHKFEPNESEKNVIYLVASGHPQEGSPYGDKAAWEGMRRL
jgi:hypothetical protein